MRLAAVEGNGADKATRSQTGCWQQQENYKSSSDHLNGAKFKAQKTRKEVKFGKPEIIAEDQTKALSVGSLSYVYSVYLLFILRLPPKKD